MLIDMHCHIDLYKDPHTVVKMATQHKMYILSVTTTPKAWQSTSMISVNNSRIRTALGLHPQLVCERYKEIEIFEFLVSQAKYIGEIGLDGSKEYKDSFHLQIKVFRDILQILNKEGGRIMSIHSRHSASDVLDELKISKGIPILHWFSGSQNDLNRAIRQGCWFSINPSMVNSIKGREIITQIPRNKILTESDGPFNQHMGTSLMPWDVDLVFSKLAILWNIKKDDVENQIYSNFKSLLNCQT